MDPIPGTPGPDLVEWDKWPTTLVKRVMLKRMTEDTFGELHSEGEYICTTLEEPWRDNQDNVSRIPEGTYPMFLRKSHKNGGTGKRDYDVWELRDVPSRDNVQIHIGNTLDHTEGCILVGSGRGTKHPPTISGSKLAYHKWMTEMQYETEAELVVVDPE